MDTRQSFIRKIELQNAFFLFPYIIIIFQSFWLEVLLDMSDTNIYNYRCSRVNKDFNISLVKNENTVLVYDKFKKIDEFNFNDLKDNVPNSVQALFIDSFSTKKAFNVKLSGKNLTIYTSKSIADEVYTLEDEEVTDFKGLFNSNLAPFKPISKKMLRTFCYLLCRGYLDQHLIILYRRSLVLYSVDGRFTQFDVDLKPFLDTDFSDGRNSFLTYIVLYGSYIRIVTNKNDKSKHYDTKPFKNGMKEYLNCEKNYEIVDLINKEKFLEIEGMVDDKEIDEIFRIAERNNTKELYKKQLILN